MMDKLVKSIRTREIIEKYKFRINKGLGQNFLIDEDILEIIVSASSLTKADNVLEIGPGIGTLTLELSENAGKVLTVEIDDSLIPILNEIFSGHDNITLFHGDAMKIDIDEIVRQNLKEPISICANIPYYITTPLISRFFKCDLDIKNIVLMVQKEVGERMAAQPGNKDYGALSLLIQYYSKASIVAVVPPKCFMPQPKVDSVIIKLEMYKELPVDVKDEKLFFNIIRNSFNQRRKTLSNSLKNLGLPQELLLGAFEKCNIDPVRRGETLSINEFADLSNEIYSMR